MSRLLLVVVFAIAASGCLAEMGDEDEGGRDCVDCDGRDVQGLEGDKPDLVQQLTEKYGVRPRKYTGLFNGSNQAERLFLRALPEVARFLNQQLEAAGHAFRVTEVELATNFITEGGYFALDGNLISGLDGFSYFGIDTLVDNYHALKPWLHPSVQKLVEAGTSTQAYYNEKGELVKTLNSLTLEEGLYANAGMFVWSRVIANRDMGGSMATQSPQRQFFWTTVYYNAGPGAGRNLLAKWGASYAESRWTKADDATRYGTSIQFNGLWRTATWDYLRQTVYAIRSPLAPPDEVCTDGVDNDGDQLIDLADEDCASLAATNSGATCGGDKACPAGEACVAVTGGTSGICSAKCTNPGALCAGPAGTYSPCASEVGAELYCVFICEVDGETFQCAGSDQKCVDSGEPGIKICAPAQ